MPSDNVFSAEELHRYSRQLLLPEFGASGQQKLKEASVLVIGSGGLGSPVLLYLAAAGIGTIGIVDFDVVDESNLQRQILFDTKDVGKPKALLAAERIRALNPHVSVKVFNSYLSSANALEIFRGFDVVVDGSDNLPTRYLSNDACVLLNKPLVYGAIFQFEGQVSVFNAQQPDGSRSPNYRDLFPHPPPPEMVPSCGESGVFGVLPGIIGSMMANETIKLIAGIGSTLSGRLLLFDAFDFSSRLLKLQPGKDPAAITGLIDYDQFCNGKSSKQEIEEINAVEAKQLIDDNKVKIIDVREPFEYNADNIGGLLLSRHDVEKQIAGIPKSQPLLVVCKSGGRSYKMALRLKAMGYTNIKNLYGGLLKWKAEVDPELLVI